MSLLLHPCQEPPRFLPFLCKVHYGRYLIRGGETIWVDGPLTRAVKAEHRYLAHTYGPVSYVFIDDLSKLPLRVPEVYRKLTTRSFACC